jgi:hypothetical protein
MSLAPKLKTPPAQETRGRSFLVPAHWCPNVED